MGRLTITVLLVVAALAVTVMPAASQAPAQKPSFEVATIKPSRPEEQRSVLVRGHRFTTTATSVVDLMMFAYEIHAAQVTNAPRWLETTKYDVIAVSAGDDQPNRQQLRAMVQELLASRFSLNIHREKKELPVFTLAAGKVGPNLKDSSDANGNPGVGFGRPGVMTVKSSTMLDFAEFLQRYVLNLPVVDRTGLVGKYDFTLNWTPDNPAVVGEFLSINGPSEFPDLFTAIQEQLGLKLESAKMPLEVLVIDSVQKPSEN